MCVCVCVWEREREREGEGGGEGEREKLIDISWHFAVSSPVSLGLLFVSLQLEGYLTLFPGGSVVKNLSSNAGDTGDLSLIPGWGRSLGGGNGNPLQYSLMAHLVKNLLAMWETWVPFLGWKIPWRREWLPTLVFGPGEFHGLHSPWSCKELIRLSNFHFTSFQYSCLKNPMDRGAWWATVHRDLKESDMPEWLSTWPQIFISLILFCYSGLLLHIFLNVWYCLIALK